MVRRAEVWLACLGLVLLALAQPAVLLPTVWSSSSNASAGSSHTPAIVFIRPVFTAAAYDGYPTKSFYGFYAKYSNVPVTTLVRTDLNLLNTTVDKDNWGQSWGLGYYLQSLAPREPDLFKSVTVLTDIDVSDGNLFYSTNGTRRFDVAVLGFSEYVTTSEYQNYKHFVETGGGLLFLDACTFYAEVSYNRAANKVSLVKGHGWEFNGTAAWKGTLHRWPTENTNWIGSNFALFHSEGYKMNGALANTTHPLSVMLRNNFGSTLFFTSYVGHEENAITNSSTKTIAYWDVSGPKKTANLTVAMYEHEYRKGVVIHTGIFGSDLLPKDPQIQFFFTEAIRLLASRGNASVPEFQSSGIVIALTVAMSLATITYYRKHKPESVR
jgi:hypothetical protein